VSYHHSGFEVGVKLLMLMLATKQLNKVRMPHNYRPPPKPDLVGITPVYTSPVEQVQSAAADCFEIQMPAKKINRKGRINKVILYSLF